MKPIGGGVFATLLVASLLGATACKSGPTDAARAADAKAVAPAPKALVPLGMTTM